MAETQREPEYDEGEDGEELQSVMDSAYAGGVVPQPNGRIKPGKRSSLHQVYDMQQEAYAISKTLSGSARSSSDKDEQARLATAFASVCGVWTKLQDTKREIRGKGKVMPVPAKVTNVKRPITYEINEEAIAPHVMNDKPASP